MWLHYNKSKVHVTRVFGVWVFVSDKVKVVFGQERAIAYYDSWMKRVDEAN